MSTRNRVSRCLTVAVITLGLAPMIYNVLSAGNATPFPAAHAEPWGNVTLPSNVGRDTNVGGQRDSGQEDEAALRRRLEAARQVLAPGGTDAADSAIAALDRYRRTLEGLSWGGGRRASRDEFEAMAGELAKAAAAPVTLTKVHEVNVALGVADDALLAGVDVAGLARRANTLFRQRGGTK